MATHGGSGREARRPFSVAVVRQLEVAGGDGSASRSGGRPHVCTLEVEEEGAVVGRGREEEEGGKTRNKEKKKRKIKKI